MPSFPSRPCTYAGCGRLVNDGTSRCEQHPHKAWARTATPAPQRPSGRANQRLRRELFEREPLCVECKRRGRVSLATQRDHIVPLAEGGQDVAENVQGLCNECHMAKTLTESMRGQRRARG